MFGYSPGSSLVLTITLVGNGISAFSVTLTMFLIYSAKQERKRLTATKIFSESLEEPTDAKIMNTIRSISLIKSVLLFACVWVPMEGDPVRESYCVLALSGYIYLHIVLCVFLLIHTGLLGEFKEKVVQGFQHSLMVWLILIPYFMMTFLAGTLTFYTTVDNFQLPRERDSICALSNFPYYRYFIACPVGLLLTANLLLSFISIGKACDALNRSYDIHRSPYSKISHMLRTCALVLYYWVSIVIGIYPSYQAYAASTVMVGFSGLIMTLTLCDDVREVMFSKSRKRAQEQTSLELKSRVRYGTLADH